MTRLPPVRVVRAATAVRTALQGLTGRMVPPEVAVLELASGFMATHATYAAARLGINRNTLHKKLKEYHLEERNGQVEPPG